jgi:hypothetical protein
MLFLKINMNILSKMLFKHLKNNYLYKNLFYKINLTIFFFKLNWGNFS